MVVHSFNAFSIETKLNGRTIIKGVHTHRKLPREFNNLLDQRLSLILPYILTQGKQTMCDNMFQCVTACVSACPSVMQTATATEERSRNSWGGRREALPLLSAVVTHARSAPKSLYCQCDRKQTKLVNCVFSWDAWGRGQAWPVPGLQQSAGEHLENLW